jgi:hypothetical protein
MLISLLGRLYIKLNLFLRRLPTVPPVKKTESYAEDLADFDSYLDDESERKTNLSSYRSNTKHSTTHKRLQLFYKYRKINKTKLNLFFLVVATNRVKTKSCQ